MKSKRPAIRLFCDDAFRAELPVPTAGAFLVEDAPLAERADVLRFAGARLPLVLVERDAVRFAFFALAMCDRPLLLEGEESHDNNRTGNGFHTVMTQDRTCSPLSGQPSLA
jgi:hypothetical protein